MRIIPVLLFIALALKGFSCYQTYQYRLFPVGFNGKNIYFMQVDLVRQPENKNLWKGVKRTLRFDGKDFLQVGLTDSVQISGNNYVTDLEKFFWEIKNALDTIQGIQFYENVPVTFAFHREKCEDVMIKRDSETQFSLNILKNSFPVKLPENSDATRQLVFVGGWNEPFKINSARSINSESAKFKIVNIGTGEVESTDMKEQMKILKQFRNELVFPELVLYHGFCMDIIIPSE